MPESGQTQSPTSSGITTPIANLQSNTPRESHSHEDFRLAEQQEFPEPTNLEEYEIAFKKPYALEYFQFNDDLRNVETYNDRAKEIDEFVKGEINLFEMEDNLETYKAVIDEMLISLNLHPNTSGVVKMEKLYNWIKNVITPQRDIMRRRKQYAPISE